MLLEHAGDVLDQVCCVGHLRDDRDLGSPGRFKISRRDVTFAKRIPRGSAARRRSDDWNKVLSAFDADFSEIPNQPPAFRLQSDCEYTSGLVLAGQESVLETFQRFLAAFDQRPFLRTGTAAGRQIGIVRRLAGVSLLRLFVALSLLRFLPLSSFLRFLPLLNLLP